MKQIILNLKKYWYMVLMVIVLLVVQAYCDLSLPQYTSGIIDVGIMNSGVEYAVPEYITDKSYKMVEIFLTDSEKGVWKEAYTYQENEGFYKLKDNSEEKLQYLDETFRMPIAITVMIKAQSKGLVADEKTIRNGDLKSIEDIEAHAGVSIRKELESQMGMMGESAIENIGRSFATAELKACSVDTNSKQTGYLWSTGAKMIGMTLIMVVASILVGFLASRISAGVGRDLRKKVFSKVMSFSTAELDKFSTASLITRSTNDVQQIQMVTVVLLRMVLYAPILAIGGVINVVQYDSGMEWIILLAIGAVIVIIGILMFLAIPKFKIMQNLVDRVNLVSREILTGLPVIRAFSREKREEERFEEANTTLTKVMLFTNRTMSCMFPGIMLVMNGVSVLIVWVAATKIDEGVLEVGAMTAFITYSMMIILGFLMITAISIVLPRAAVAANRIKEILDTENIIVDEKDAISTPAKDGVITFKHVDFKYPDGEENVLTDIDFVAKPGETTAIIGSTGSGKSTVVKLIPRFFDVTGGEILLDGINICNYSLETLRKQIGYVPQQGVLFSGDIESNIAFGAPDADESQIKEAAEIAQALDFIEEKTEGFKSAIAQGGTNVSGGQKQRLSIARAIARNPKIYIFDDSFSALDFKTDVALRKALQPKTQNSTVLIVAQRVSTILNAEQIIVLDEGRMVGKGTHKKLVKQCEIYRQIAQSQLSEEEFAASIGETTVGKED